MIVCWNHQRVCNRGVLLREVGGMKLVELVEHRRLMEVVGVVVQAPALLL